MKKVCVHSIAFVVLTMLTQLGGFAWLIALACKWRISVFIGAYILLSVMATFVAPHFSRVPLSCMSDSPLAVQSWFYCVMNRNYVHPDIRAALQDLATEIDNTYPGTKTLVLDANFPFLTGFPLLPHLSHDDGRKVDIAFYYRNAQGGYLSGRTRSPIGYFAFEQGPTNCPDRYLDLRWDLDLLQPVWPDWQIEPKRTRFALQTLASDPRIGKIFVEPHLLARLRLDGPKFRFQGCNAARHDDHIHFQL
ncbi:hypothetical protein EOI86_14755 [Hwanghaeella grinnelliae]|uniref:Uncharacterized protein n=2 Tax=Hwanghaeella grinnelliae TaxID=2500179 RepID=A0A437QR07_9PROT|nr:hypothetical protein EOI86_14755 [Hwanghaeella grinnelliae]